MHRIDSDASTIDHKFTDGNPGTGTQATVVDSKWLNGVQENMCLAIEAAGITLAAGVDTQLLAAIRIISAMVVYHVGAWWITDLNVNPATYWGFGTWEKRPGGIYGQLDGDSLFSDLGPVGSKTHIHNTAGHALTLAENGPHGHPYRDRYLSENLTALIAAGTVFREAQPALYNNKVGSDGSDSDNDGFAFIDSTTTSSGSGTPHFHGDTSAATHLMTGHVVYVWRRTA